MKNTIKIAVFFFLISLIFFSCEKKKETSIIIGSTVPLTGEAATWGNYTKNGAMLAIEEYNSSRNPNDPKIDIIFEDTKATAKDGINAFNKLVTIHKVKAIVDDAVSAVALAIAPLANKEKVVIISTGATNPKLSEAGPFYFRVWNSDFEEGIFSANYCFNKLNIRKVAVLAIENDYGQGLSDVFEKQFKKLGGLILIKETYKQGDNQFRNQLLKIKNTNADAIYMVSYPEETPQILIQMKNIGLKKQIIGTVPMQDKSIIEKAKAAAEGVIYPYPTTPHGKIVDEFNKKYKERFNEEPGTTSAEGYDAAKLLIEAIKMSGNDGEAIRNYLQNKVKNWRGASGIIEFDENGDVHKPMVMKMIKNGEFIEIKDEK